MSSYSLPTLNRSASWPYLLLIAVVLGIYIPACGGEFILDDHLLIVDNPLLRHWSSLGAVLTSPIYAGSSFYRPLQMLLYLVVYQIAGPDPVAYHLLNVSLHAANACLLYRLGLRLGFNPYAVLLAALLWAVHPLHVEALAYISGTADPLSFMFCLLALLVMAPDFTPRRMLAAIPLFVCALLSKESAVVFPLLAMTCIFLQRKDLDTYIRTEFLWLTDGIYLGLRFHGGGGAATPATAYSLPDYNYTTNYAGDIVTRIYTSLATLPDYARLLLWPVGLHEERSFPIYADPWHGAVIAGAILVLAALAIIICCRASWRPLSWGLLWFGAAHGINSGIPLSLDYIIAEHWMYVPSAGLFLGLGQSLASTLERKDERLRRTVFAGGVLVAALLAALTFRQGALWHDVITLFGNTMIYERSTSAAHVMLGNAYLAEGDDDHAIEQYRRAIRMLDKLPMAPANLAVALFARRQGTDVDEAIAAAEHALALSTDPVHADIAKQARETLAALYDYKGDKEKAEMYRQSTSGKN